MKTVHSRPIFSYQETLSERSLGRIPHVLKLTEEELRPEAILFRLLLGSLDIFHNFDSSVTIKQRQNYAYLGMKSVGRLSSKSVFDSNVPVEMYPVKFSTYITRNRLNDTIYEAVLSEFSNFFYSQAKGAYTTAFIHLYRCLEHISYTFPLIYAAKSRQYFGTYKALKSYFSDQGQGEIKFFRNFQTALFEDQIRKLTVDLKIHSGDQFLINSCNEVLRTLTEGLDPTETGDYITITYEGLFDLVTRLRNRYFHYLHGSHEKNIHTMNLYGDCLFKSVNDHIANWLAFIYFEICRFGVEQI